MIGVLLLAAVLHGAPTAPIVTCEHETVSYRFVGHPGDRFGYAGEQYTIPANGWIEIVRTPGVHMYTTIDARTLLIDDWPIDAFGTRHVAVRVIYAEKWQ